MKLHHFNCIFLCFSDYLTKMHTEKVNHLEIPCLENQCLVTDGLRQELEYILQCLLSSAVKSVKYLYGFPHAGKTTATRIVATCLSTQHIVYFVELVLSGANADQRQNLLMLENEVCNFVEQDDFVNSYLVIDQMQFRCFDAAGQHCYKFRRIQTYALNCCRGVLVTCSGTQPTVDAITGSLNNVCFLKTELVEKDLIDLANMLNVEDVDSIDAGTIIDNVMDFGSLIEILQRKDIPRRSQSTADASSTSSV